jgi:hypothetical protein
MEDSSPQGSPRPLSTLGITLLGLYLLVIPLMLAYLLFVLWPSRPPITQVTEVPTGASQGNVQEVALLGGFVRFTPSDEARFILLVIVAGALGSYIHAATSFADYVGNRQIYSSWVWWYVLRTFVGLCLALIFYFVIRGGLLSAGATSADISPFGIAAVSGRVGMFSKQATDKLSELFDNLFKTDTLEKRADKLTSHPMPKIESITPDSVPLAGADLVLIVKGINFVPAR